MLQNTPSSCGWRRHGPRVLSREPESEGSGGPSSNSVIEFTGSATFYNILYLQVNYP